MNRESPLKKNLTRRTFLRASLFGLGGITLGGCSILGRSDSWLTTPGLATQARQKGRVYGAAVQSWQLEDGAFASAVRTEVALLVPETELKWDAVHPAPDRYNFSGYHRLKAFAQENDMAVRGHVLVWHHSNPDWLEPALTDAQMAEKILRAHIERVIRETSPFIREWDVVNEAVHPSSTRADILRPTLWLKALGPDYIPLAYRIAHEADRNLTLVYNDYGLEYSGIYGRRKREGVLRLLEKLLADKVPVHALGLQSHLRCHRPLDDGFLGFLAQVRDLGLKISMTELDLDITRLSGEVEDRIAIAQNYAAAYLDMIQLTGDIDTLLTWGLSDRYSWMRSYGGSEGMLPLDSDYYRGPLWETLRSKWAEA